MKILHIIDSGGLYGAEVMLLTLAQEQMRMGLRPVIASIGEKNIATKTLEKEALNWGIETVQFRMHPGFNYFGAMKIRSYALSEGFQILHSHGYKGNILFGFLPKNIRCLPLVATLHGWTTTSGLSKMSVYEKLDRLSLRFMDAVVLVSAGMKNFPIFQKKRKRLNLFVISNGLAPLQDGSSITSSRTEHKDGNGNGIMEVDAEIREFCRRGPTIGCIGRLSREKGQRYLIEALHLLKNEIPEIQLVIIGEGNERMALEQLLHRLDLSERVMMPGYRKNARVYLPFFDIFVLPSLTEGLPITLLEAMQEGVPILASGVGGLPYVIEDGKTGILVNPGDTNALSKGLKELYRGKKMAEQLSCRARRLVNTHYTSAVMAQQYNEVYQAVLSKCPI